MSKILIVDDSPDLLNIFNWSLERKGYNCATAYYKEGLFHSLSKFTPTLIILDINLQEHDGRDICMEIKQNPVTKNIPIILCSGRHDLLRGYAGYLADDFIEKPFEINSVIKKIELLLAKTVS